MVEGGKIKIKCKNKNIIVTATERVMITWGCEIFNVSI
jgi:hypothetical protein